MTVPYTFSTATSAIPLNQLDANFSAVGQSTNISYQYSASGTVARTASSKMSDFVSINDFGAVGDGTTDDTAAIQNAINSLGALGGTVYIPNTMQCYVASDLTVKANCGLKGAHIITGSPKDNTNIPYAGVGSAIRLASTATINMNGGSALQGLLIYRQGMTFPVANSNAFAGTAVKIIWDDVAIFQCQIMGFQYGIKSVPSAQRPRIYDCNLDNTNGIYIDTCPDILHVNNVQCWPFAGGTDAGTGNLRSGSAFTVINNCDWGKFLNCFSYGYSYGFTINGCNDVTLIGCGSDGPPTQTGSKGIAIVGTSAYTILEACQVAGRDNGIYINTSAGVTFVNDCVTFSDVYWGILIDGGNASILGGKHQGNYGCIGVNNLTSIVNIDSVTFDYADTVGTPVASTTINPNIYVGVNNLYLNYPLGTITSTLFVAPYINTASTINLPAQGSYFRISGAGTISNIVGGSVGRTLTLQFLTANTVIDNSGNLQLAGNLTANNNTILQLIYNGTNWLEISRSVNG
jgi:hypothetical protein